MPEYTVIQPVEHDHQRVEAGVIELPADAAVPLLAVRAIAERPAPGAGDSAPGAANTPPSAIAPSPAAAGEGGARDADGSAHASE